MSRLRKRSRKRTSGSAGAAAPLDATASHDDWAAALARAGQPTLVAIAGSDTWPSQPTATASPAPLRSVSAPLATDPADAAGPSSKVKSPKSPKRSKRATRSERPERHEQSEAKETKQAEPTMAPTPTKEAKVRSRGRRKSAPATESTAVSVPIGTAEAVTRATTDDLGTVDVERALRLVRTAAALIAMAAVIGARSQEGPGLRGPAAAVAILVGAGVINLVTSWTSKKGWANTTALGGQVLDVVASLGLVYLLDQALDGSAWMVMLLPIVMGGVRFGASGTLLAWTLASVGYLALVLTGTLSVTENKADEFAASLQRFAFLLALAVPVAALTQWLQQRWEHQRSLTMAASQRAQRLELIEALARSFIGSSEPKLLANLADAGVQLGFETVTITLHSADRSITVAAVGRSRRLPTDDVSIRPEADETLVTHWSGADEQLTSVSIMLDATGNAIAFHGWSTDDIDEDLARAFGLLGAHASVALRAARMLADLEREAKQDPLTGLLNRRAFDDQIDQRAASGLPAALLFLDVDHFKAINDGYGHPAGDKVLRIIAERLRSASVDRTIKIDAAVARVGGDEFAVLISGAPLDVVADVAERIETSMTEPVALGDDAVAVSFSIGIADAAGIWAPRELIEAADEATYQAKTQGRNRTCWAPDAVGEGASRDAQPGVRPPNHEPSPRQKATQREGDPLITLFQRSMDMSAPAASDPPPRPPA